ncbi:MAG: DoxX family protein [Flavobacteriaceae bacterium]
METLHIVIQSIIAIGIFNVWIFRFNKPSIYRAADAINMESEFKAYGFDKSFMNIIGFSKLSLACLLIAGIWFPNVVNPSAFLMGCLMIGAIGVHIKINDPLIKSLPAFTMLVLCSLLIIL